MRGTERLAAVARSTPAMAQALPELPMAPTVLVRLIRVSVVGLGQYFEPVFRGLGLTEHSFHVLCLLLASEGGTASPSALSELVGTSRANMTRILDELVAASLVRRSSGARDARRIAVRITAAGRRAATQAVPRLAGPLEQAFSGLSPAECASLECLLRKVIESFDNSASPLRVAV